MVDRSLGPHLRELQAQLSAHVEVVAEQRPDINLDVLRLYLKQDLLPYLNAEEMHVLPAVATLTTPTGKQIMTLDLAVMRSTIRAIENEIFALETAPSEDVAYGLFAELRRLLIGLEALLALHLEKVMKIYAPLLNDRLTDAQRAGLLADIDRAEKLEALGV